jgi:hypothetical protein
LCFKPAIFTLSLSEKCSRNNSASQADYAKTPKSPQMMGPPQSNGNSGAPFKPVPPPKPKNYRPPIQGGNGNGPMNSGQWENGVSFCYFGGYEKISDSVFSTGTCISTLPERVLLPASALALPPLHGPQCAQFAQHEPEFDALVRPIWRRKWLQRKRKCSTTAVH